MISVTETSYRMAPTLCQKWLQKAAFCQKVQNFVQFGLFQWYMVQTLFKECMERLKTPNVSISNGNTGEF